MKTDAIKHLAKNLVEKEYNDIPPDVIMVTKKAVLDTLAAMIAGTNSSGCSNVAQTVIEWGGKEESSIINYDHKAPAFLAALVNGTMARAIELDDVFEPGTMHGSASIVATAFAVAEMMGGIDGRRFLNAITLAVDFICRMGLTNKIPPGISGMNVTFQYAYFGCAGVAGKIMGLTEEKMINAMGLAYSQTSGNSQNLVEGTFATPFSQGMAADAGLKAAIFANKGITAANEVLEGKFGYYNAYQRGEYDREKLLDGLGETYHGANVTTKMYPCCMHTHAAIDAMIDIAKRNNLHSSDVEKIIVKVNEQGFNFVCDPVEKKRVPKSIPEAHFSMPYTVATALVKGKVFLDDFTEQAITTSDILEAASKIDCVLDPELDKISQGRVTPAIVEVQTKTGERLTKKVDERRGSPSNPMSMEEIADKFRRCAAFAKRPPTQANVEKILAMANEIESLDDVTPMITLL